MKMTKSICLSSRIFANLFLSFVVFYSATTCFSADWPNYRGPDYNGISAETGWSPKALSNYKSPVWQTSIGIGFSSITVANGKVYSMGNIDDQDIIYCLNADTGKEIWRHAYKAPLDSRNYEGGPSSTPTVEDSRVYTLSKRGMAFCLNADNGQVIWSKDMGVKPPTWGFAASPVIIDDLVILNIGSVGWALNKNDGSIVWQNGEGAAGYASAVPYVSNGKKCIAIFTAKHIVGLLAETGSELWRYPWETSYDVNAADPVIFDDKVLIASGYNKGCALLKINDDGKVEQLWRNNKMRSQMNGPILWQGHFYGIDDKQLNCLNAEIGQVLWTFEDSKKGSLIIADDKLVVLSEKGRLIIAEASPDGFKEISSAQILSGKCWTTPTLSNGRLYARNANGDLVCVDLRAASSEDPVKKNSSLNWPQWYGPNRNNKTTETGLLKSWPEGGPKMLWLVEGIGKGFSTVAIVDDTIYITGMPNTNGVLFAYDLDGNLKWQAEYGPEWTKSFPGTRSTPTIELPNIYIISGLSAVYCLDAKTGQTKWQFDAFKEYGDRYPNWGFSESPLIVDEKIICTIGGKSTTMIALDKNTGKLIWQSESTEKASAFCSPIFIEVSGQKTIVNIIEQFLIGVDAANGKILWKYDCSEFRKGRRQRDIHPNAPLYHNGDLYITSGYDNGSAKLHVNDQNSDVTLLWSNETLDNHHGGVVLVDGYIYGSNWLSNETGNWVCLDWKTGKVMYETPWNGKGVITYADGMLYCYEEKKGNLAIVKASPEAFEIVSSFQITQGEDQHWAFPVICNGRLYVRHGDVLMVYDIKAG